MTHNMDWLVQRYASFFQKFGIERDELISHYEFWKEKSGATSITDYLWYLFHVLLGETRKQVPDSGDLYRNLHEIYLVMLEFRLNVEGQKDNSLVQLIIKNRIQLWQRELPYPFRLQAISLNCCPYCESINGQVFEAEEVLRNPHFASPQCTAEQGCSCGYIPVGAEGNN
jgi:hypothetical protein